MLADESFLNSGPGGQLYCHSTELFHACANNVNHGGLNILIIYIVYEVVFWCITLNIHLVSEEVFEKISLKGPQILRCIFSIYISKPVLKPAGPLQSQPATFKMGQPD